MEKSDQNPDKAEPAKNDLEKILKEKFGDPNFGGLMNSIVDQMLKGLAENDDKAKTKAKNNPLP
ncbi:MAG: hypothetical protein M3Y08_15640 [Fibrobacterota bacterium]|nr:hypothetical protein [Fibrobacterota bacterium]